jgi:2-amino-4-hydroxy-6-hydroxymethyldihydropteridine diphosphokinase
MKAYVGIGSNLGDRKNNIMSAISLLGEIDGVKVLKVSSIYETEPVDGPPQGKYLNGVIELETELGPHRFLKELNEIESLLGRKRREVNGPRTIDLDILTYGELKINERGLVIPHPRMNEREFVLRGLKELAEKT